MIKEVLHIGFAVKSIDETMAVLSRAFGAVEIGRREIPAIGQTSALVSIGDTKYELMEPLGEEGVVPKFIAKYGEGFHHISFLTDNIDEECENMQKNGVKVLNKTVGDGKTKFFTHPKTTGGVIYEISELPD